MAKKEKVVDLKPTRVSDDHLKKIQERNKQNLFRAR